MSSPDDRLTADDLEFLARPLHGFLTTAARPTPPQPRPVWFAARYWDLGDPVRAHDLAAMLADEHVRLIIHPEAVHRSAY